MEMNICREQNTAEVVRRSEASRAGGLQAQVETRAFRRLARLCDTCAENAYYGLVLGPSGAGLTSAARRYAGLNSTGSGVAREHQLHTADADTLNQLVHHCRVLLYSPPPHVTEMVLRRQLGRLLHAQDRLGVSAALLLDPTTEPQAPGRVHYVQLLIIDDAERLHLNAIAYLCARAHVARMGLILIGAPELDARLARAPRLARQFSFRLWFGGLSDVELAAVFDQLMHDHPWTRALAPSTRRTLMRLSRGNPAALYRALQHLYWLLCDPAHHDGIVAADALLQHQGGTQYPLRASSTSSTSSTGQATESGSSPQRLPTIPRSGLTTVYHALYQSYPHQRHAQRWKIQGFRRPPSRKRSVRPRSQQHQRSGPAAAPG